MNLASFLGSLVKVGWFFGALVRDLPVSDWIDLMIFPVLLQPVVFVSMLLLWERSEDFITHWPFCWFPSGRKRRPLIQQPWLLIGCAYTTWCWIRNLQYHTYRSGVIYSGILLGWELFDHFVSLGFLALLFWNLEGMNRKESSHSRKSQTHI